MHRLLGVALAAAISSVLAQTTGTVPFVPTIFPTASVTSLDPDFAFLGNNSLGPSWTYPTWSVDSTSGLPTCTVGTATNNTRYTPITLNISDAGVYQIAIQTEQRLRNSIKAFVLTKASATATFSAPANPCDASVPYVTQRALGNAFGTSGGPQVNDFVYLAVGFYDLIVTSSSSSANGLFAVNIWKAAVSGSTTPPQPPSSTTTGGTTQSATTESATTGVATTAALTTGTTGPQQPQPATNAYRWFPTEDNWPNTQACDTYSTSASYYTPFRGYQWTATLDAVVDVVVAFDWKSNNSDNGAGSNFVVSAALYQGNVNEARIAANPCDPAFNYLGSIRGSSGDFSAAFWKLAVTTGTTYTIIVSGGQGDQWGNFGIFARPTIVRSLITTPPFSQPDRSLPCTDDTTSSSWYAFVFQAAYAGYLIDTGDVSGFNNFDSYSFLYRGVNNATPPVTCPAAPNSLVFLGDTGDVTPLYSATVAGSQYTVVVSTYTASRSGSGDFALYVFSGTTVNADGTVVPNSGPTGGASSTASSSTTGGDVGAASSVAVNIFLVVAALAALLF